ncbi:MAG: cytochrome c oxidase subunit 3, partial [Deltaproteobacteria bacterium]
YASTFFAATGFHGLHVTLGALMILIVWWQARLGEAKKKKIKYRPTRTDNSPKNSVYPDDNLPRAKKNLSFTP